MLVGFLVSCHPSDVPNGIGVVACTRHKLFCLSRWLQGKQKNKKFWCIGWSWLETDDSRHDFSRHSAPTHGPTKPSIVARQTTIVDTPRSLASSSIHRSIHSNQSNFLTIPTTDPFDSGQGKNVYTYQQQHHHHNHDDGSNRKEEKEHHTKGLLSICGCLGRR